MIGFLLVAGVFFVLWETARKWGGQWGRWAVILFAVVNWFSGLWLAHEDGVDPSPAPAAIMAMIALLAWSDRKARRQEADRPEAGEATE